ncbi:MAG: site-2 protease family protein [Actinobacteria bacterium]|nr:site-2 protease family protein [Actinomycetota bacterium]
MESVGIYALGVAFYAVCVAASIALHEVGHLVPAKRFGIKCSQYMVGFGPTVWSRQRGETEYGIKAIPLGGYVRMLGMFPPKPGQPARVDSTGRLGMLVDQARSDAQRDIGPEDADRLFYQRSVPKRVVVMLGGPTMNLLIAAVLFTLLWTTYGLSRETPVVDTVSKCVVPVAASKKEQAAAAPQCTATSAPTPAVAAGIQPGDRIVEFAGTRIEEWSTLQGLIRANPGRTLPLVVERAGAQVPLQVTLIKDNRYELDGNGLPVVDDQGRYVLVPVGFLGVSPTTVRETLALTEVPGQFGTFIAQTAAAIVNIPSKMVGVVKAATFQGERDPNGPISVVGAGRIVGEIASVQGTPENPINFSDKFAGAVQIVAGINLALFLFNLVPLLPLDGGHVAGALWEAVRRRVNRLLRRPDPGPVDIARLLPLTYVVASLLLGMSVLLIYADIVNPIRITG